jgi:hypothetical protein
MPNKPIPEGTLIIIHSPGHWMDGEWGTVTWSRGDEYGIAPWGGTGTEVLLYRDELRVPKKTVPPGARKRH